MKKRLFFDMDNELVDFQSGLDKIDEETKNQYRAKGPGDKDRLDEIPGLFGKMEPMPGAIEAVHRLAEVYDVLITLIPLLVHKSTCRSCRISTRSSGVGLSKCCCRARRKSLGRMPAPLPDSSGRLRGIE